MFTRRVEIYHGIWILPAQPSSLYPSCIYQNLAKIYTQFTSKNFGEVFHNYLSKKVKTSRFRPEKNYNMILLSYVTSLQTTVHQPNHKNNLK